LKKYEWYLALGETGEKMGSIRSATLGRRIAGWAIAGLFVVCWWFIYVFGTLPIPKVSTSPVFVWNLIQLTCPIAFIDSHFHLGLPVYGVMLANAATYAVLGLIVETMRRKPGQAK